MPALIGGGSFPTPGEITLAHHGILFLDELPEFSRRALESLRQPLESGTVTITRVEASLEFPCRFTLIEAMNPCPCGYAGSDRCRCTRTAINKYQQQLSGPLLDRIDLQVWLRPLTTDERFAPTRDDVSPRLRQLVQGARDRQQQRFVGTTISCNAAIPGGTVADYCQFSPSAFETYKQTIASVTATTRSTDRLAKVSRTIADLAGTDRIEDEHVREAATLMVAFSGRETE
jgi:magnesium chelatase family protein